MEHVGFLFYFVYLTWQKPLLVYLLCTLYVATPFGGTRIGFCVHAHLCMRFFDILPGSRLGRLRILFLGRRRAGTWNILEH